MRERIDTILSDNAESLRCAIINIDALSGVLAYYSAVGSFVNAGYPQQVAEASDALRADRQLVLDIRTFGIADGPDPVAEVEFSAKIMSEGRIAAARIFHATMPAKADDAAMMTAAIDQVFGTTATELVVWTIGLI